MKEGTSAQETLTLRSFVIETGYTVAGMIPVEYETVETAKDEDDVDHLTSVKGYTSYYAVSQSDYVFLTSSSKGCEQKIVMIHNKIDIVFKYSREAVIIAFLELEIKAVWNWVPLLALYCSEITEGKDMGGLLHGWQVTYSCSCCTATIKYMNSGKCGDMRNMLDTLPSRTNVKKLLKTPFD